MEKDSIKPIILHINFIVLWMGMTFFISGCGKVGEKSMSMTVMYVITVLLSVILLFSYCMMIHKKEPWFLVLFSSVVIVNVGYLALAISKTLEEALLANRIAYLGSVFLPLAMFMIIMNVCRLKYKKWMVAVLVLISLIVFLVAASPGYLDIYYKDVVLETVNGVTVLGKTYGAWHVLYLFYLLGYFGTVVAMIFYAKIRKKPDSQVYATILGGAVFVNIGVWLLEQMVKVDFEILSVSYIITEFFLLSLCMMMQEKAEPVQRGELPVPLENPEIEETIVAEEAGEGRKEEAVSHLEPVDRQRNDVEDTQAVNDEYQEKCKYFAEHLYLLTKTEKRVYEYHLEGKTTKEIMDEMEITQNTLKYHNKNIYSKLGVSSRKQLQEIGRQL